MALYLGGKKVKINLAGVRCKLNIITSQDGAQTGVLLLSSDGFVLKGSNGLYLTVINKNQSSLIDFNILGTSFQAEEGMTWGEWVESEYNTVDFYIDEACGGIHSIEWLGSVCDLEWNVVHSTDVIASNGKYKINHSGGSN